MSNSSNSNKSSPTHAILQINLNPCSSALDNCLHLASSLKTDIILLSETYTLHSSIPAPGWTAILNNKSAILVKTSIPFLSLQPSIPNLSHIQIKDINILSIYCPPPLTLLLFSTPCLPIPLTSQKFSFLVILTAPLPTLFFKQPWPFL